MILATFGIDLATSWIPEHWTLTVFGRSFLIGHAIWVPAAIIGFGWMATSIIRSGKETHSAIKRTAAGALPCKRCGHPTVATGPDSLCYECGRNMPTDRLRKHWEDRGMPLKQSPN